MIIYKVKEKKEEKMMNIPEYTCKLDYGNIQMLNSEARKLRENSIKTS